MKRLIIFNCMFFYFVLSAQTTTPVYINGVFNIYKEKIVKANGIQNRNSASAYFTYTPTTVLTPSILNDAGQVRLNNKKLKYNSDEKFYGSRLKTNNGDADEEEDECNNTSLMEPMHWKVKGEGQIPKMNFIYGASFPELDDVTIPNSIDKSDTLIIAINTLANSDSISVYLYDNYFNYTNRKYLSFVYPINSLPIINGVRYIKIAPTYLNQLADGPNGYLSIIAFKKNYQTVSGKQFLFNTSSSFIQPIITISN